MRSPSINWEAIYTLLKRSAKINRITMQCFALQGNAVRKATAAGKSAPAGARRAPYERLPVRCCRKGRRLTDHASFASVDAVFYSRHRTAAGRTNDQTERSRFLFVLFLSDGEKDTFPPLQRRRYVLFSLRRKAPKDSPRRCLGLLSIYWGAHTHGSQQTESAPTCALRV